MPSFLDKLQKGMETDEENLQEIMEEESEKPKAELTSAKKKTAKKTKKKDLKKEETDEKESKEEKKTVKVEKEKPAKEEKKKTEKGWFDSEGELTIDLYETEDEIVIRSAVAGVKAEDLDITFEDDMVIIRGKREEECQEENKNFFFQECYWGYFSREVILPKEVDSSRAKATIKEGVLVIRIPKMENEGKKKIAVKSEDEE